MYEMKMLQIALVRSKFHTKEISFETKNIMPKHIFYV